MERIVAPAETAGQLKAKSTAAVQFIAINTPYYFKSACLPNGSLLLFLRSEPRNGNRQVRFMAGRG
ncbi:hypothetical protein SIDU_01850 [Sphingobium indicum B90A]|uniref:Uncharacterized protein n=1 Tax=Sphingobium indicum (strain DSM 16412 / CCM 7286 / MTCC 6364 / B90A) TaxID=861109 RepID=A0A1L5BKD7_SPHIB|nr:hypothetical protein SIDU_01850 [Sphingobium indicum B90A]